MDPNISSNGCKYMNEIYTEDLTTHTKIQVLFGFIYLFIITLSVIGNACVILAILKNVKLRTVRNIFILSLAISDIGVALISGTITPIFVFMKDWIFGRFFCQLAPMFQGMAICLSTFTLSAIAIDRFILIVHPAKRPIQNAHALLIIVCIWTLSAFIAAPVAIHQDLITYEHEQICGRFCQESWGDGSVRTIYGTILLLVQFVLPLGVIIYCYIQIWIKLDQGLLLKSARTEIRQSALIKKQKTNRMLVGMVAAFSCSWFPQVFFNVARDYQLLTGNWYNQVYFFGVVVHCLAMTSTLWNPLLYAGLNEQFRNSFLEMICARSRRLTYGDRNSSFEMTGSLIRNRLKRDSDTTYVQTPTEVNGSIM